MNLKYKKIAIKLGSNVLAAKNGLPDKELMGKIVAQIAALRKQGVEIVLISSGAVAAGRSIFPVNKKLDTIAQRQVFSSIGQVELIKIYTELFASQQLYCSQVLVTREDFRSRTHYVNMKNCLSALLGNGIIPVINENDVVSVSELMFTDNDELAGMVASMLNMDALFILSNVDGVFNGDPKKEGTKVIPVLDAAKTDFSKFVVSSKSDFGRGGMITKCRNAQKIADLGIAVHIANGKNEFTIAELMKPEAPGTLFPPRKNTSNAKKWLSQSANYVKGEIIVNEGAKNALLSEQATSLLPIGVVKIKGSFEKGDIVKIKSEEGTSLGVGKAEYSSEKAIQRMGKQKHRALIHYDYLFLD
ncbi:glutamate 5-kinase [Flammeovirgaceae bacterium SG7u.111]|nr:glutamate 5-kinase [Flammeovirgaceae bacterium SG7u.132]WPO35047.1 glutamate 5-kinase [Flammeovirgaceae bacterium SG7u.111]